MAIVVAAASRNHASLIRSSLPMRCTAARHGRSTVGQSSAIRKTYGDGVDVMHLRDAGSATTVLSVMRGLLRCSSRERPGGSARRPARAPPDAARPVLRREPASARSGTRPGTAAAARQHWAP